MKIEVTSLSDSISHVVDQRVAGCSSAGEVVDGEQSRPLAKEVARVWAALLSLPLDVFAACEGQSVQSFLSDITGLSPAHMSTRGLAVKSSKRLDRVAKHVRDYARQSLEAKGYLEGDVDQLLEECPQTPLAGLVHRLGQALPKPLELAMEVGSRIDKLAFDAMRAAEGNALEVYRELLLQYLDEELPFYGDDAYRAEILELRREMSMAVNWSDLQSASDSVAQYALLATLSAVDAEWCAHYFRRLAPTPTFPWLFPRFHADFDASNSKGLKRNIVDRPVGRVLDLLWSIAKRGTNKQQVWPDAPPGASLLARDIAHEMIGDGDIRKWSCGARPLLLDQMVELWASLTQNLSNGNCIDLPIPWMAVALWMERAHVRRRPKSSKPETVIVLSDTSYRAIWLSQRTRWKDQLPEPGDLPWPGWLLAQSSGPDWLRSIQSSGLPSSPRDCQ